MDTLTHNLRLSRAFRRFGRKVLRTLLVLVVLISQFGPYTYIGAKTASAASTVPKLLNYQARITDDAGVPVPDGNLNIWISVYDAPSGGSCLYAMQGSCGTPDYKTVNVTNGVFSMLIGDTVGGDNAIPDALFDTDALYLGVTVASDTEMVPRKRITAAPYAMNADRLDDMDVTSSGSDTASIVALTSNGNLVVTGDPQGGAVSAGAFYLNPSGASASETLFGIADAGSTRWMIDKEGDVTHSGSLLATAASSTAQFVFRGAASQVGNVFEVQDAFANRLFAVSATNIGMFSASASGSLEVVGDIYSRGTAWTSRTSANTNAWRSVAYGNGLFVAVADSGTGNRVMTSPDGVNWTVRTSAADNTWRSVTYGNGLFVAVSTDGGTTHVMTSPDGVAWTLRTSASDTIWNSVTYGNGLFVAVANAGSTSNVMTSPDGVTWTLRTGAANLIWNSVAYGNGTFTAVASSGSGNRVMTSPDGVVWTSRVSAADNSWLSVTYGNGVFVAVASDGTDRVMTSPDGVTWTARSAAAANFWRSVTFGAGLFVAVSSSGSGDRVMTSPDGVLWTSRASALNTSWLGVAYGNGVFAAVAGAGAANSVMTSGRIENAPFSANNILQGGWRLNGNTVLGTASTTDSVSFAGSRIASNLTPTTDATYDLGDYNRRWRDLWLAGGSANIAYDTSGTSILRLGFESTSGLRGRIATPSGIPLQLRSGLGTTSQGIYISGSNDVGIGTSTPNAKLQVVGDMTVGGSGNITIQGTGAFANTADDVIIRANAARDIIFRTNSITELVRFESDGDVGIGNSAPANRLTVGNATSTFEVDAGGNIVRVNAVPYSWPSVQGGASTVLTNNGSGVLTWAAAAGVTSLNTAYLSSTSTTEIYITPSQGALTIADTFSGTGNIFEVQDRTNAAGDYSRRHFTVSATSTSIRSILDGDVASQSSLNIFEAYDAAGFQRSVLRAGGRQSWYLNDGSGSEVGQVSFSTPTGQPGVSFLNEADVARADIRLLADTGGISFGAVTDASVPTSDLVLLPDGSVGIGDSSPDSELEVEFNQNANTAIMVTNTTDGTGAVAQFNLTGTSNRAGGMTLTSPAYTGVSGFGGALWIDANALGPAGTQHIIMSAADDDGEIRFFAGGRATTNRRMTIMGTTGHVGIGNTAPANLLTVGSATSTFEVNAAGNLVKVNNVPYSWPASQGGSSTVLTNDGSGVLTWSAPTASTTLQQAYDNDANGSDVTITTNATDGDVIIAGDQDFRVTSSGLYVFGNNTHTTTNPVTINATALTSGAALTINGGNFFDQSGMILSASGTRHVGSTGTDTGLFNLQANMTYAGSGFGEDSPAFALKLNDITQTGNSTSIGYDVSITSNSFVNHTQRGFRAQLNANAGSPTDVTWEDLYFADNADTSTGNQIVVTNGYRASVTGGGTGMTNGFSASPTGGTMTNGFIVNPSSSGAVTNGFVVAPVGVTVTNGFAINTGTVTNGINFTGGSGMTTDFIMQNGESIDNDTNGIINTSADTFRVTGASATVDSMVITNPSQTSADLLFLTSGNSINQGVLINATGTYFSGSTSADLGLINVQANMTYAGSGFSEDSSALAIKLNSIAQTANSTTNGIDLAIASNSFSSHTQRGIRAYIQPNSGSPTDATWENLVFLDNADTATGNQISVTDALLITNSGNGTGMTNAITIGASAQPITTAINIASTGVTTDIRLQNGLIIQNDTASEIRFTDGTNTLCTITDAGTTGNLTCTGTLGTAFTLQNVYDNDANGGDATITTNSTDGDVIIAGDQDFRLTATGQYVFGNNTHTTTDVMTLNGTALTTGDLLTLNGGQISGSGPGTLVNATGTVQTGYTGSSAGGLFTLQANMTYSGSGFNNDSAGIVVNLNDIPGVSANSNTIGYDLNITSNGFAAHTQRGFSANLLANSGSPTDNTWEALYYAENLDTATGNQITVTSGFQAHQPAGVLGMTNGFLVSTGASGATVTNGFAITTTGGTTVTNGINFSGGTGITTDFVMQNGETIDNNTNGIINAVANTFQVTGQSTSADTLIVTNTSQLSGDLLFLESGPSIDQDGMLINATGTKRVGSTSTDRGLITLQANMTYSGSGFGEDSSALAIKLNDVAQNGTSVTNGIDLAITSNSFASHTQRGIRAYITANSGSPTDVTWDNLILLDNADTATGNQISVTDALLITNSGNGAGMTNAITIGASAQPITTAINIASTGVTTDIRMQNGEVIHNDTDGTISFTDGTNVLCSIVDGGSTGSLSCTGGITASTSLNQAYLNSTSTTEIYLTPSQGALSIADTFSGTGTIFEILDRTNAAGNYGRRYFGASATSTLIGLNANGTAVTGYEVGIGQATPTARLHVTPDANTAALKLTGFSTTGTDTMAEFTGTWNTASPVIGLLLDVTDTASGAQSQLISARLGGNNRFTVGKNGAVESNSVSGNLTAPGQTNFGLRNSDLSTNNFAAITWHAPNNSWGAIAGRYLSHSGNGQGELLFMVNDNAQGAPTTRLTVGATTTSITNDFQVDGNSLIGSASNSDTVTFLSRIASNFTPTTDATYDLGDHDRRWRDLWISGGTIHIGDDQADEGVIAYDATTNRIVLGAAGGVQMSDITITGTCTGCGGSTTLQQAYGNDADGSDVTITTNSTDGDLVIAGDQDFRFTATGDVDFDSNTFVVDSSTDRVGIGVAAPLSKLHISGGDVRVDVNTTIFANGTGALNVGDNSDTVNLAAGTLYALPNNGNVGIGSSAPAAKLAVADTNTTPTQNIFEVASSGFGTKYFTVSSTSTTLTYPHAITSPNGALNVTTNAITSGMALQIQSSATAFTGNLAYINLSGNNANNTGSLLQLNSSGSNSRAKLLEMNSASANSFGGTGAVRLNLTGNHSFTGFQIDDATTNGTAMLLNAPNIQTGHGLLIDSTTATSLGAGSVLKVVGPSTCCTGANSNGIVADFRMNGNPTGNNSASMVWMGANGLTTGRVLTVNGSDIMTSGGLVQISTRAGTMTSGSLLSVSKTSSSAVAATYTGNLAEISYAQIFSGGNNNTGRTLSVSRNLTINGAAANPTISGSVTDISDSMTVTLGSVTHTANVLSLSQNFASASGAVLKINNSGTGDDIEGSGGTWSVDKDGNATFASCTGCGGGSTSLLQGYNASTSTDATPGEIYLNSTRGAFTISDAGNRDDGSGDNSGLGGDGYANLFEIVDRTTAAGHYSQRYFWASATGVGITGGIQMFQGGPGSNEIAAEADFTLNPGGGTGSVQNTGSLLVDGNTTLGNSPGDAILWNASNWTLYNALNMGLGANKWSITSTSGVSNAIEVIGNSISSASLIAGTANGLSSGNVQWWTTSAGFSGNMVKLDATGAATGDFIELTSTSGFASARAINIDFDNANSNNVIFNLVTDETSVSGTAADTEKFAILASGSVRGDGNLTFGSASGTNTVDFSGARIASNLTPTTDDTFDLGDWNRRWRDLYLGPGSLHIGPSTGDEAVFTYDTTMKMLRIKQNGGIDTTLGGVSSVKPLKALDLAACTPVATDYNAGYSFTPKADGYITALGARKQAGTQTVYLYEEGGGTSVRSVSVTTNGVSGDWVYADITPYAVTAGATYIVSVRGNSTHCTSSGLTLPINSDGVLIGDSRYIFGSNNEPDGIDSNIMYGQADVVFQPTDTGDMQNAFVRITNEGQLIYDNSLSYQPAGSYMALRNTYNVSRSSFHLQSSAYTGFASTDGLRLQMFNLNANLTNLEDGNLTFGTNGTTRMTIGSTGDISFTGDLLPSAAPTIGSATQTAILLDGSISNTTSNRTTSVIGADGLPVIAYKTSGNTLAVIKCDNAACSSYTRTIVDSTTDRGDYASITLGTDGFPIISYYDNTNGDLRVAKCGNAACSSGNTLSAAESTNNVGLYTSIAVGIDGLPVISHFDSTNSDLRVTKCGNAACSSGNTSSQVDVAGANVVGTFTSIEIGADGLPVISYWDGTLNDLKVAACANHLCSSGTTLTTIDNVVTTGNHSSLAIGADGLPVIAYRDATNGDLKVAKCANLKCNSGTTLTSVATTDDVGEYPSIVIGQDGFPIISYLNQTLDDLIIHKCGNAACSTGNTAISLETTNLVGYNTSIIIGQDGNPFVTHMDATNSDLRSIKCADQGCRVTSAAGATTGGSDIGTPANFFNNVYANAYWGRQFQISNFDVAEAYRVDDLDIGPGDLVRIAADSTSARPKVEKASGAYGAAVGIISTKPAIKLSSWDDEADARAVALVGRVPTKVSMENGPIKAGDPIAVSSLDGVGMRSTKPGMIVGTALMSWNGPGIGTIEVFVKPIWHSGLAITTDGTTSIFGDDFAFDAVVTATVSETSFASRALSFRGSAWDGASNTAVTRNLSILNEVTDASSYQMAFRNDDGNLLAALNQAGDLAIAGSLTVEGGFDYAEMFPAVPDIEAGDIVMIDPDDANGYGVKKTQGAYENSAIGVISTKPGFLTGKKEDGAQPVALAGRVPVKISMENGEILPGDPITSSSTPGVGMKAVEAGRVIGLALQSASEDGTVLIFVNPSWWNGPMPIGGAVAEGTLSIQQDSILDFKNSVLTNVAAIISTNGSWSVTSDGHLVAQKVEAKDVVAETFTVKAAAESTERTVGVGRIQAGYDAVLVPNAKMKPESLVIVTFEGNPGANWWIDEKAEGHFVLKMAQGAHMDLSFTYWIVPIDGLLDPTADEDGSASGTPETPPAEEGPGPEPEPDAPPEDGGGETESGSGTEETP